jgi:hypothetical protein
MEEEAVDEVFFKFWPRAPIFNKGLSRSSDLEILTPWEGEPACTTST